jgi:hypothetical protein
MRLIVAVGISQTFCFARLYFYKMAVILLVFFMPIQRVYNNHSSSNPIYYDFLCIILILKMLLFRYE